MRARVAKIARLEKIETLDAVRAVAALIVLGVHSLDYARIQSPWISSFGIAVDIFFVLSGYIVAQSAERSEGPRSFFYRRARRILPLYYMATSIEVLRLILRGDGVDTLRLLKTLLFLPHYGGPMNPVGWTINFEVYFYSTLGLILFFRGLPPSLTGAAVMAALALVNPIFIEFALGCLLRPLPLWCGAVGLAWWAAGAWHGVGDAAICDLTTFGVNSAHRVVLWAIPAFLIVGAALGRGERPMPRFFLFVARESFGLYLFQYIGLMAGAKFALVKGVFYPVWLCLASIAVSLALSRIASRISSTVGSMVEDYVARSNLRVRRVARERG